MIPAFSIPSPNAKILPKIEIKTVLLSNSPFFKCIITTEQSWGVLLIYKRWYGQSQKMVRLQFQYMSIRRTRRRQATNLVNEQQEQAKQKLFEISYFDDEKHFDESHILHPHTLWQRQIASERKEIKIKTTKEMPSKKKSYSSAHKNDDTVSIENLSARKGIKKLELQTLGEPPMIFNTLESNRVFVGNKNFSIITARPYLSDKLHISPNKKRIETMPSVKQRPYLKLLQEEYPQSNRQIMSEPPKQRAVPDKWRLRGLVTHKNAERQSYIKLKNKLKRDLFNTIEQRMALNNQILYF